MKWWSGIESGIRFSTASNASEARKILTTCWQRVFSSSRVCSISIRPKTKVYSTRSEDNERGSFKWCRWKFHRIMRMNIMVASRFFWNFHAEHIKQLISYMKWLLLVYYTLISTDTSSKVYKNAWILCCIKGFGSPPSKGCEEWKVPLGYLSQNEYWCNQGSLRLDCHRRYPQAE